MAPESKPPPPQSNNSKYVIIGLVCLLAAAVLWIIARRESPAPAEPPPAPPEVARVNPMAEPELELLPEEEPDAGPEPEPEPRKKKRAGPKRGIWDCSGDLEGAAKVVRAHRSQIRNCYERRLKVNNILQGSLRLKVRVGANGKVVRTAVSGSLGDNEVFGCVRSIAESWSFSSPTGGTCAVLDVPFSFSPKTN